jgi:hypothetical protein
VTRIRGAGQGWTSRILPAFALALAATALARPARAIDIERLDVRYESGHYRVQFDAELSAPPDSVERVLTDYAHYPELDARIEDSHLLPSVAGEPPRLYTRLKGCLGWLLCRSMVRIETLEHRPGALIATAIPDLSDVRESVAETHWQASAAGTRVSYALTLSPKFWVPSLFGRRAMLETMRKGTVTMFTSVEREARALSVPHARG